MTMLTFLCAITCADDSDADSGAQPGEIAATAAAPAGSSGNGRGNPLLDAIDEATSTEDSSSSDEDSGESCGKASEDGSFVTNTNGKAFRSLVVRILLLKRHCRQMQAANARPQSVAIEMGLMLWHSSQEHLGSSCVQAAWGSARRSTRPCGGRSGSPSRCRSSCPTSAPRRGARCDSEQT